MKNTVKAIAGAAFTAAAVQAADINGNILYFQNMKNNEGSYPEFNSFYSLPGNINGYTWGDVFKDGSYFGKTILDREVAKAGKFGVNGVTQVVQGNKPASEAGLGMKVNIPVENGYASVGIIPAWTDTRGNQIKRNLATFAYGKGWDNRGINFETFAEIDINGTKGYGRFELTRRVLDLKVGLMSEMYWNGKAVPKLAPGVCVRYDFSAKLPFWKKFERKK